MKKIFAAILFWWNYKVLKKEREEIVEIYGKDYNKKNNLYFYKDVFNIKYIGVKEIVRTRIARTFIKESEYIEHNYDK